MKRNKLHDVCFGGEKRVCALCAPLEHRDSWGDGSVGCLQSGNTRRTECQNTHDRELCPPVKLGIPHQGNRHQRQRQVGDNINGVDRVSRSQGHGRREALSSVLEIWVITAPKEPNRITLENGDEEVENVDDADHEQQHDKCPTLPFLARVAEEPDQVDADDEFDEARNGHVGGHAKIFVKEGGDALFRRHVDHATAHAVRNAEASKECKGREGKLKPGEVPGLARYMVRRTVWPREEGKGEKKKNAQV